MRRRAAAGLENARPPASRMARPAGPHGSAPSGGPDRHGAPAHAQAPARHGIVGREGYVVATARKSRRRVRGRLRSVTGAIPRYSARGAGIARSRNAGAPSPNPTPAVGSLRR